MKRSDQSINTLSGVGKVTEAKLNKMGIFTIADLVYHFPRAYEKRGDIQLLSSYHLNENCSYVLTISTEVKSVKVKGNIIISKFRAFDDSGSVEVIYFNSPYVKDIFHIGATFRFYGKLQENRGKLQLTAPKHEPIIDGVVLPDFSPLYPLTSGISAKTLEKLIKTAISEIASELEDPIPESIRLECSLPSLGFAIKNIHYPESEANLSRALERMAFEELLVFGTGVSLSAKGRRTESGVRFKHISLEPVLKKLPYELTQSQKQSVNDIYRDTVIGKDGAISPMARIIVGDVGCGKTICAALAIYIAQGSGYQSALMVPTEILARQHYDELSTLLGPLGVKCELLIGSTSSKEKRRIRQEAESGDAKLIIGTHALLSDELNFNSLGLIITDEQHRFGVMQRGVLKEKAKRAHLLVMSATPIPRTLALTLYGDLDISRITELPKGRQRVDTFVIGEDHRARLNNFILKQVSLGGQCYVVCPSIDEMEEENEFIPNGLSGVIKANDLHLRSAISCAEDLRRDLPQLNVGLLHGKMKSTEKDAVMKDFAAKKYDVLVSTTVIEVGINVTNANLMIVENAERFGLSQLHQLRGRVGRGNRKSYCVLISDSRSEKSSARLKVMTKTYDGYEIAENDLLLRGPGDFFSSLSDDNIRQSGGFKFKFAQAAENSELLSKAFSYAKGIVEDDPTLNKEENKLLKEKIEKMIRHNISTIS